VLGIDDLLLKKMKQVMKHIKTNNILVEPLRIMIYTTLSYYLFIYNNKLIDVILNANICTVQFQKTALRRTHILKLNYLLISATLGANCKKKKIRNTEICVLLLRWIFQ
jgi:hypothetical protein